ncbi:hypothetical protein GQ53DRAFT_640240 [Thozetella sp. PMI_491]|nr:hypothetical protein GQ53DRAFT_640240 [Thozetella sp. PMI_491]
MSGVVKWILGNKKLRKKAFQTVAKSAKKIAPIVQTVQATLGTYKISVMADNAVSVAGKAQEFIPSMQVMGKSFANSAKIFACFSSVATVAGIGMNVVVAYQGLQVLQLIEGHLKGMAASLAAQTALAAQKSFPQYVHDMIRERVTQTSQDPDSDHWFFVFHPDNDWYPGFYHLVEKKPIGPQFCGYTNQIDTAFVFMLAARRHIERKERRAREQGRPTRPIKLHLLIPAYQPILISEALRIPEEIGEFVMEGRTNSNKEFVWLNLPQDQRRYVQDIGHFDPPPQGLFNWALSTIGLAEAPLQLGEPRVLGTRQEVNEDQEDESGPEYDGNEEQEAAPRDHNRHRATPLHHQHRRHARAHRRGDPGEGRGRYQQNESTANSSSQRGRQHHRSTRSLSLDGAQYA